MARIIPVTGYPFGPGYDTPEAAIRGAQNHPLQQKARAAGAKLANTEFIDACWTDDEYYLRFSNYRTLHVFAIEGTVDWEVLETPETTETPEAERVGAEGVLLDWGAKLGRRPMDCSELIAKRRGAEF